MPEGRPVPGCVPDVKALTVASARAVLAAAGITKICLQTVAPPSARLAAGRQRVLAEHRQDNGTVILVVAAAVDLPEPLSES
ncbi:MAG: hypothetical protein WD535_04415 [Thermaerobacterales bacterium]